MAVNGNRPKQDVQPNFKMPPCGTSKRSLALFAVYRQRELTNWEPNWPFNQWKLQSTYLCFQDI